MMSLWKQSHVEDTNTPSSLTTARFPGCCIAAMLDARPSPPPSTVSAHL